MRILAQQGFGPKDKLRRGIAEEVISGVILSPRYNKRDKMQEYIDELTPLGGQILMDPEFYAARYVSHPASNLGQLETWDYFRMPRRSALISGTAIPGLIQEALEVQKSLGLREWIAPNVFIDEADSIDTAIALNIISQTKTIASECGSNAVFATLALSREAIMNRSAFQDVIDALTALDSPPDGFYILLGCENGNGSGDLIRSDIYHPQVIAGWMYMNYVLAINKIRVINGYCHLLSPFLGICGAEATASGWHSGLRQFSMNRYVRESSGGRAPAIRYVSTALMARIRQSDYLAFKAIVPEVSNGLALDAEFENTEPSRTTEALQSWEATSALSATCHTGYMEDDLPTLYRHVERAMQLWINLQQAGFTQEVEANLERLSAMRDALDAIKEWAEIA